MARVAESDKLPAGLNGVSVDLGDVGPYFQKYSQTPVFPFFDRFYLPNGMREALNKKGQDLLAGAITPDQFSDHMKNEYQRLQAAAST